MTVRELIDHLINYDSDATVVIDLGFKCVDVKDTMSNPEDTIVMLTGEEN